MEQQRDLRIGREVNKRSIVLLAPAGITLGLLKHSWMNHIALRTQRSFRGFLGVRCMLLQLIITLCTMQYLISVGFPKDPGKRADQPHCSKVALLKAGHIVKRKLLKPVLREQLITFVLLIYFMVINAIRSRWPLKKKKTLINPSQRCKRTAVMTSL